MKDRFPGTAGVSPAVIRWMSLATSAGETPVVPGKYVDSDE